MINTCFIPFPNLHTQNLLLRSLELEDSNEIFILRSDPEVNRYLDRNPASTEEDALQFIQMIRSGVSKGECLYWAICDNSKQQLLGTICLWNFDHHALKVEIGYELLPSLQGKGIMLEAAKKVIDYGFNTLGVQCIEASLVAENTRSTKLLEKCGFQKMAEQEKQEGNLVTYTLTQTKKATPR